MCKDGRGVEHSAVWRVWGRCELCQEVGGKQPQLAACPALLPSQPAGCSLTNHYLINTLGDPCRPLSLFLMFLCLALPRTPPAPPAGPR